MFSTRDARVSVPYSQTATMLRSVAFASLIAPLAGLLLLVPVAPTIAVVQATAEFVSYDVVVPDLSQLRLAGFAISYEGANEPLSQLRAASSPTTRRPLCLDGILTPTPGTHISYRRFETKPLAIVLERTDYKPVASFEQASGNVPDALRKSSWIRLDAPTGDGNEAKTKDNSKPAERSCPGDASKRLPIFGTARIGSQLRPESGGDEPSTGLLLEGTIDLYGRTIELGRFWDGATRIYPTGLMSMSIPPGSQISEFVTKGASPTPWTGYVKIDKDEALDVRVTTPATRIQIMRPGGGLDPEIVAASLFAQLTNDPTLLSLQILSVIFFSVLRATSSVLEWHARRKTDVNAAAIDALSIQESAAMPMSISEKKETKTTEMANEAKSR